MQKAKHILSAILALGILCSGFPMFAPEDANRDTIVSLEDAILHVRDFVKTADSPEGFMLQAERTITTLKVLAGVGAKIGPTKETKSKSSSMNLGLFYLSASIASSLSSDGYFLIKEPSFLYRSISVKPQTPPPERPNFLAS